MFLNPFCADCYFLGNGEHIEDLGKTLESLKFLVCFLLKEPVYSAVSKPKCIDTHTRTHHGLVSVQPHTQVHANAH